MTKKVIIIGSAFPLRGGGLATFNERLAREFQDLGYETIIYTFSLQYPGFLFPGKSQYSEEEAPENLDIRVRINSINPFNWIVAGNQISREMADLVVYRFWLPFMGPCLGTIARIIRKNKKSRQVAITDNIIPHEKRPGDKWFTSYFLSGMDGFIAMSQSVLHDISIFDTQKPRAFVPHPLYDNFGEKIDRETAIKNLKLDPAYRYILFFGFIRAYKGLDILLDAFAEKEVEKLPLKLIIAGEFYQDSKEYETQIENLGIENRIIRCHHFIPNAEVANYFCASDLVVQPYKEATQSGVTQVAYHFNVPMIVTDLDGLRENVPDGKVGYVTEANKKAVAGGIVKFFSESKLNEFSENMEVEKKKFSWISLVNKLFEVGEKKILK